MDQLAEIAQQQVVASYSREADHGAVFQDLLGALFVLCVTYAHQAVDRASSTLRLQPSMSCSPQVHALQL